MNPAYAERLEQIIVEHTKLALEFVRMKANGGDTEEEAAKISARKAEIQEQIKDLREERELLYEL